MNLFLWGGTGQAKVIRPIVEKLGHVIKCVFDPTPNLPEPFPVKIFSDEERLEIYIQECEGFVVAIGGTHGLARYNISNKLTNLNCTPVDAIHATAYVAQSVKHGKGSQVMARAVISELVSVGDYSIFNTSCVIDHECIIGNGVHIMGGAHLAGCVQVEDFVSIGTNATILPRIKIGTNAIIGAGAVVTKDVAPGLVVVGVPAKPMKK